MKTDLIILIDEILMKHTMVFPCTNCGMYRIRGF